LVYTHTIDTGGQGTGWQQVGSWTAGGSRYPPSVVSVAPSSGGGVSQTFSFVYSDADGYADLSGAVILVNSYLGANNACYLGYSRTSNIIGLANDAVTAWDVRTFGSAGVVENSQCALNLGASSASGSGNLLTLNLALTFKPAFAGAKLVYTHTIDTGGQGTGWQQAGIWTVQ
ncbi:MAG: hypothetical protein AAB225_04190, partial [Acidobacteriota bacterium]